ncbi:AI-2E family transporter [Roseivirga pacifica]|uniref:AI-2E family transporter n=1 Tax=Roseivirga pacifica TaxID=1267423 RepID=UPI002095BCDB|nr:AI-2E family transporter [Roseivirga pacifica]MCO6360774.1 AI-2E family transporter [Roseivirga pacifica]MCO6368663.1 AI-2E family transporter [Roseivirga pacifica]MCO6372806.1 AI-2E family transporter [Roseivirga pacifica]MCO6376865.1 AI-2E family transporter [Roseivirga pacifica]MCO6377857.1 AI-2E family transporter [Roseivirga pacifica]
MEQSPLIESNIRTIKNTLLIFLAIVGIMIIKALSGLLIPLAFAIFVGLMLQPVILYLDKKNWPYSVSITLITILTLGFLFLIGLIVFDTGAQIVDQKDKLLAQIDAKFIDIIDQLSFIPGVSSVETSGFIQTLNKLISVDFLLSTSGIVAGQLGTFTFNFILSAIYLVAVLGSIVRYEKYIGYLEGDDQKGKERLINSFLEIKTAIVSYMKVKFFTSFCTGVFFGGISWIFGVDFALFWGFLAFLLNFIPTVGSIAATIPPVLLGLIQIDSTGSFFLFIGLLIATQFIWGNVIEPLLMGSSVALNTVTVILGLVVWGYIWGVAGMLLSVPLIVLARVILAQIPDADMLVKLMGRSELKKQKA